MEFIKNIHKDFVLKSGYLLDDHIDVFSSSEILVRLKKINMENATFRISKFESVDASVDEAVEILVTQLKKDVAKWKVIAQKIIKAWEESPELFKRQKESYNQDTFKRTGLLKNHEYMHNLYVFFGDSMIANFEHSSFCTGCGEDSYYNKDFFVKAFSGIDEWLDATLWELQTKEMKKKMRSSLLKKSIQMDFKEVLKHISIPV